MTVIAGGVRPAQEDVRRRLHHALPDNDALALVDIDAAAGERGQDRLLRLLDLQDQGVVVGRRQQRDSAERADGADADDLERDIDQLVAVDENVPIFLQRRLVSVEGRARGLGEGDILVIHQRHDLGRLLPDPQPLGRPLDQPRVALDRRLRPPPPAAAAPDRAA